MMTSIDPDNLLQFRERLDIAGEYLCGKTAEPDARKAYAAILYVQSSLKLDAEEMKLAAQHPYALKMHLECILGNLGSALRQRAPSDDAIIMDHVQEAYGAVRKALIIVEDRPHTHAAGTAVGKHIDECAVCGKDIRHPIHSGMLR